MSIYPNSNNDMELLKIKTKVDEISDLKYKTEKHDFENMLKSLNIDHDFYRKKCKSLKKKKIFMSVSETLIDSVGLGLGSGLTVSGLTPIGIMCASSISFYQVLVH